MLGYVHISSKYDKHRDGLAERLKLGIADKKRSKRCGKGKNHSTNKERSYAARKAHSENAHKIAANMRDIKRYIEMAKAYWRGDIDAHP